jgi:hypothetical protein
MIASPPVIGDILMGTIQREEHEGRVSLSIQPLSGGEFLSMMRIRAEVSPPDASRRTPKIEIFFHGSAYAGRGGRMSIGNARAWGRALHALIAEAEKVAEKMHAAEPK